MVKKFKVNKYGQVEVGPNDKSDGDKHDSNRFYVRSPFIIIAAIIMILAFMSVFIKSWINA